MADASATVVDCTHLAYNIRTAARAASGIQRQNCQALAKSVGKIESILSELEFTAQNGLQEPESRALLALKEELQKGLELVQHTKSMGCIRSMLFAGEVAAGFTSVLMGLEDSLTGLQTVADIKEELRRVSAQLESTRFEGFPAFVDCADRMRSDADKLRLGRAGEEATQRELRHLVLEALPDLSEQQMEDEIEDVSRGLEAVREDQDHLEEFFFESLLAALQRPPDTEPAPVGDPGFESPGPTQLGARTASWGGSEAPAPPEPFLCPLGRGLMRDPVMLIETGMTYDRANIEEWFARGNTTCPFTKQTLSSRQLAPNLGVRSAVEHWVAEKGFPVGSAASPTPAQVAAPGGSAPSGGIGFGGSGGGSPGDWHSGPPSGEASSGGSGGGLDEEILAAAEAGSAADVSRLLRRGANLEAQDPQHRTPLLAAANEGHLDVVRLLLDKGAYLNTVDNFGSSALHLAAVEGHAAVAGELLDRGIDLDRGDSLGSTPLHWAVGNNHVKVVEMLLAAGCNANAASKAGNTLLHLAAINGNADLVRQLITRGADVQATDSSRWTPLHWAAANGHTDVVALLVQHRADIAGEDMHGKRPSDVVGVLQPASGEDGERRMRALLLPAEASKESMESAPSWPPHMGGRLSRDQSRASHDQPRASHDLSRRPSNELARDAFHHPRVEDSARLPSADPPGAGGPWEKAVLAKTADGDLMLRRVPTGRRQAQQAQQVQRAQQPEAGQQQQSPPQPPQQQQPQGPPPVPEDEPQNVWQVDSAAAAREAAVRDLSRMSVELETRRQRAAPQPSSRQSFQQDDRSFTRGLSVAMDRAMIGSERRISVDGQDDMSGLQRQHSGSSLASMESHRRTTGERRPERFHSSAGSEASFRPSGDFAGGYSRAMSELTYRPGEISLPPTGKSKLDRQFLGLIQPGCRDTELVMKWANLGTDVIKALAIVLINNSSLESVDIQGNKPGPKGAKYLASALKRNSSLRQLNMGQCEIGGDGGKAIGEALKVNGTLQRLNLWDAGIGLQGAFVLAEALKTNTALEELDVGNNELGPEVATAFAEMLRENVSLKVLDLRNNRLSEKGVLAIAEACQENTTLRELKLQSNGLSFFVPRKIKSIFVDRERTVGLKVSYH